MMHIRTIAGAAQEIKKLDPCSAITEHRIRQLVNEQCIPHVAVGNRKLVRMDDIFSHFATENK